MKTFTILFNGRERGAIGIFYRIQIEVEAENEERAKEIFFSNEKWEPNNIISIVEKGF